jgi:hypothetical protein
MAMSRLAQALANIDDVLTYNHAAMSPIGHSVLEALEDCFRRGSSQCQMRVSDICRTDDNSTSATAANSIKDVRPVRDIPDAIDVQNVFVGAAEA